MVLILFRQYLSKVFVRVFLRQQAFPFRHQTRQMLRRNPFWQFSLILLFLFIAFSSGCGIFSPKTKEKSVTLLKTEDAPQSQLLEHINRFARVNSMRAKMDLKFEDNSYAELGIAEKYKTADGEVVVQRPANLLLNVQVPITKTSVAQLTS